MAIKDLYADLKTLENDYEFKRRKAEEAKVAKDASMLELKAMLPSVTDEKLKNAIENFLDNDTVDNRAAVISVIESITLELKRC